MGRKLKLEEVNGRNVTYNYDLLGRLNNESIVDPSNGNRNISYTYDAVSNRLSRNDSVEGVTSYIYNSNDELTSESNLSRTRSYTYDANGNQLTRSSGATDQTIYAWDARNRLIRAVVTSDGQTHQLTYKYDAIGNRISQTVDGVETRFLVDTNRELPIVVEEYTPSGIALATYAYGTSRISQTRNGTTSFYHGDANGTVRSLTNLSGVITDQYWYDAFGRELARTGSTLNNMLYNGEPRERLTGLDHLRARSYDFGTGRFASTDPFPGVDRNPITLHRYLYAGADPVNRVDPTGLFFSGSVSETTGVTGLNFSLQTAYRSFTTASTFQNLASQVDTYITVTKIFVGLTLGFVAFASEVSVYGKDGNGKVRKTGGNVAVVLYAFEDLRENAIVSKVELRFAVNARSERVYSINWDSQGFGFGKGGAASGPGSGKVKVSIAFNVDDFSKSSIQAGVNVILAERKAGKKPTEIVFIRLELASRVVFRANEYTQLIGLSPRFGIEATFLNFGKSALTLWPPKDDANY